MSVLKLDSSEHLEAPNVHNKALVSNSVRKQEVLLLFCTFPLTSVSEGIFGQEALVVGPGALGNSPPPAFARSWPWSGSWSSRSSRSSA